MAKFIQLDKNSISTNFIDLYDTSAKIIKINEEEQVNPYEEGIQISINFNDATFKQVEQSNSRFKTKGLNRQDENDLMSLHNRTLNFINMVRNETFEAGYSTSSEIMVSKLIKKNPLETKAWLNSVFLDYMNDVKVILGILHIISHLDYSDIYPEGQTMALAVTGHKNIEIREYAVRAFENWGSSDSLKYLKQFNFSEQWLQEYVDEVISDLEEE